MAHWSLKDQAACHTTVRRARTWCSSSGNAQHWQAARTSETDCLADARLQRNTVGSIAQTSQGIHVVNPAS
jgi:hypothetical protein